MLTAAVIINSTVSVRLLPIHFSVLLSRVSYTASFCRFSGYTSTDQAMRFLQSISGRIHYISAFADDALVVLIGFSVPYLHTEHPAHCGSGHDDAIIVEAVTV